MNELPFGGIEHFFMAKIMAIQLFEEKQVEGGKDEGVEMEGVRREGVEMEGMRRRRWRG